MIDLAVETPRLHLRRMTPDDVPSLLRVFGDAEVMRYYPAPFDEGRMQRLGAGVVARNSDSATSRLGIGIPSYKKHRSWQPSGDPACHGRMHRRLRAGASAGGRLGGDRDRLPPRPPSAATEAALGCLNHGLTTFGYSRFDSLILPQTATDKAVF